ncbi:DUF192 domain-containing protein [Aegicerativicinus sediminis]|uniref:DUF192 domain-containing protein n=1 Tax=Aegicerativicinus sediminis TaxID=2893202 RepID=UPI001E3BC04C|nr:DUF192 domain-containing protein [Aegicerativicinus sediminis]
MKKPYLFVLLLISVVAFNSCKEEPNNTPPSQVEIKFTKNGELSIFKQSSDSLLSKVDIEIADDEYKRETGLMYRKGMKNSQGMLFIFPDTQYRSFYMKNTEFPLDILYIGADKKIVSIVKNAKPEDETSLPSEAPAKYVLELNGGLSDILGVQINDRIEFSAN